MSELQTLPAEATPATALPFSKKSQEMKASEKIQGQRESTMALMSWEAAKLFPRNEKDCHDRIMELCDNVYFASEALYAVPRGKETAEGFTIDAAAELARIWGNMQSGVIDHGAFGATIKSGGNGRESQMQAYAIDLETNYRRDVIFTMRHWRDTQTGGYEPTDEQTVNEIKKARASKEERNVILRTIPKYIREEAIKRCKRTMHQEVKNVKESWEGFVKLFSQAGISEESLFRYINAKPGFQNKYEKITAADIVELRVLMATLKEESKRVDEIFPERKKVGQIVSTEQQNTAASTQTIGQDVTAASVQNVTAVETQNESSTSSGAQQNAPAPVTTKPSARSRGAKSSETAKPAEGSKDATATAQPAPSAAATETPADTTSVNSSPKPQTSQLSSSAAEQSSEAPSTERTTEATASAGAVSRPSQSEASNTEDDLW